ncbi:MAG: hypothetical protein FJ368_07290, partial [Pelagibacterales bacterium]|nr:hypothetical protein [Pelagibacterales bacterium]
MPKLVIKIVDAGTDHTNQKNGITTQSATGHMWWELYNDNGEIIGSYGFAPDSDHEGNPIAPGEIKYDDNIAYNFNTEQGDYKKEFDITQDQLINLQKFVYNPFDNEIYNFSSQYNGLKNSCIDFTWTALAIAGLIKIDEAGNFFNGDLIPTWNIDNIEKLALEGEDAYLQKKNLTNLDASFDEYVSFIESYYSVKIVNQNDLQDLLTKYNLNTNLSDYSNSIPTIIINDGNGNNFNLAAFPDFSSLFSSEKTDVFDQF